MRLKLLTLLLLPLFYLSSCDKDSDPNAYDAIIDNPNNPNKFNQLVLLVNLTSNNESVVVTKIDSLELRINGKTWGTFASLEIDTTAVANNQHNNFKTTTRDFSYSIIAPYTPTVGNPETAGDFIDLLSERMSVTPGDYICEISRMKLRNEKNELITLLPRHYKAFSVTENTTSAYVGKIEIIID